jgi:predicted esterase
MNSWYDILTTSYPEKLNETQILQSTKRVLKVIEQEAKLLNDDYSKIFIGGFSQGCCMSINIALYCPGILGAVIGLSGRVFTSLLEMIENTLEDDESFIEKKEK